MIFNVSFCCFFFPLTFTLHRVSSFIGTFCADLVSLRAKTPVVRVRLILLFRIILLWWSHHIVVLLVITSSSHVYFLCFALHLSLNVFCCYISCYPLSYLAVFIRDVSQFYFRNSLVSVVWEFILVLFAMMDLAIGNIRCNLGRQNFGVANYFKAIITEIMNKMKTTFVNLFCHIFYNIFILVFLLLLFKFFKYIFLRVLDFFLILNDTKKIYIFFKVI